MGERVHKSLLNAEVNIIFYFLTLVLAFFSRKVFLDCLGGPDNIKEVTNCATRLRVTVADPDKVAPVGKFTKAGAFGLVKNGKAVQVIVGLSVPQVRSYFDALLKGESIDGAAPQAAASHEETSLDSSLDI